MRRLAAIAGAIALAAVAEAAAEPPRFIMACAPCHGFDGIGHDAGTPNLAGQKRDYLYSQIMAFRSGRRKHAPMDFFSRQMTQEEAEQIANYYATLPR